MVKILNLQNWELLIAKVTNENSENLYSCDNLCISCVSLFLGYQKTISSRCQLAVGFFNTLDCMGTLCNLCISLMLHGDWIIWKCSPRSGLQKYTCLLPRATYQSIPINFYLIRFRCLEGKQCGAYKSNINEKKIVSVFVLYVNYLCPEDFSPFSYPQVYFS